MHPLGCFGSSIAFAPDSSACSGCSGKAECQALVEARRPTVMRLLSKFYDGKGDPMSFQWETKAERKARKAAMREAEQREHSIALFGQADTGEDLKRLLDKRSHKMLDRILRRRINPRRDNIERIGAITPALGELVASLRAKPCTMRELTQALVMRCGQPQSSAQRTAYALVSILTVCDRAKRCGPLVELK